MPKFLARRKAAKSKATGPAAPAKSRSTIDGSATRPSWGAEEAAKLKGGNDVRGSVGLETPANDAAARIIPAALANLPSVFHKRYLMNFTVLMPEQQRAAEESECREGRDKAREKGNDRNMSYGRRGRGGKGASWGDSPSRGGGGGGGSGQAMLKDLARRGVLERDEVKAMLKPGPLQDFRRAVLQVRAVTFSSCTYQEVFLFIFCVSHQLCSFF